MTTTVTGAATARTAVGPGNGQFFFIQRLMPGAHVLDAAASDPAKGTSVITFSRNQGQPQQWQFVPSKEYVGWWYLQTQTQTEYVMTLEVRDTVEPPQIVVQPKGVGDADRQLWCLVPTEKLGYWFIQSKLVVSNSQNAVVIGVAGNGEGAPAVGVTLNFEEFEAQAWGFSPVS
jgi:hypothetical protein